MSNFENEKNNEESININGYINYVNNWNSETEIVKNETAIEEDHNLNINSNNIEHPIVLEMEIYCDQYLNDYANNHEDEEKNNAFNGNEYEEFEKEKEKNIKILFSEYLEYVFIAD